MSFQLDDRSRKSDNKLLTADRQLVTWTTQIIEALR